MFKVAILGCENSHARTFLKDILENKCVEDIEFVGVYSDEGDAAQRLSEEYGVYAAKSYDEFVGKIDGLIITARHGDSHYKFAKPYIKSGIPMFIDKPITCSEEDAKAFMEELKENNVPVCGGSVCVLTDAVKKMKALVEEQKENVLGGFLRAPVNMENKWGNFHFYSQHLVQVMTDLFGYQPKSVQAFRNGDVVNCVVRYDAYDVNLQFTQGVNVYYAGVSLKDGLVGDVYPITEEDFHREFMMFYELMKHKKQPYSYEEFFAPVYIINAIDRSLKSGREELVN